MPIRTAVSIEKIDQDRYHAIDRIVTGFAFDIHNEYGRLLDESFYKQELTRRCRDANLPANPEMQIDVSLDNFTKTYFVDHLIDQSVIIESKTLSKLNAAHRAQTLNYLYLCDLQHATLLNLRSQRVEREFVSTRLTRADRGRFEVVLDEWRPKTPRCQELRDHLDRALLEWGVFLEQLLYRDALTHFMGGERFVVRKVPVYKENDVIGSHKMHMIHDDIAFSTTASSRQLAQLLQHQRRFLRHTRLRSIHWINFDHHRVTLHTIDRE